MNRTQAEHGRFPLGRWIAFCALAEAIGMSASAAAARATEFIPGAGAVGPFALIVVGGLIEGLALGLFQSAALARWLPQFSRRRWMLVTVIVAGLGWAAASAPSQLSAQDDSTPPIAFIAAAAAGLGIATGAFLGAAQAGGFRQLVRHPWRWIGISAVAWIPTMIVIFLGATSPNSDWSFLQVVAFGAATGTLAGAVLGLLSGILAPSLLGHSIANRIVARLLNSPGRRLLDKSLVVMRVRGRNSGAQFELPVRYTRIDNGLVIVPGRPERKQWWRNLRLPTTIEVLLDGEWRPATAVVLGTNDEPYAGLVAVCRERRANMRVPSGDPIVVVTFQGPPPMNPLDPSVVQIRRLP